MSDKQVGNAFLDIALVGMVIATIGVVVSLVRGDGLDMPWLAAALFTYAAYVIGALRLGVSPLEYLRTLTKRGHPPT